MRHYFTKEAVFDEDELVNTIKQHSIMLHSKADLQPLFDRIGNARIVMLGEASHGTHEYYTWRKHISKRLIEEKGFNFIAVEGDWPDCYRLHRFVKGYDIENKSAFHVLNAFNRWPTWMWANWEIVALAEWMQQYNKNTPANKRVGFYGLDVYSLHESMQSIMQYLQKTDPAALKVAEEAFRCFEPYSDDEGKAYARASQFVPDLCKNEVIDLLKEIQTKLPSYNTDHENVFCAEQNAHIAVNAEKYYRSMMGFDNESWNVRDRHMMETLDRLINFHGPNAKAIVWEHNTHIGDARATDMKKSGMINIGQLAREEYGENNVYLVGFGSYSGKVIAGDEWGAPMQEMQVPQAREGSIEYELHRESPEDRYLLFNTEDLQRKYQTAIRHRAIGVVYNPERERFGNYVASRMSQRYDAFIYLDDTTALHPLHLKPAGDKIPETYPFGL